MRRVAIVAMGASRNDFFAGKLSVDGAEILNEAEVWGINFIAAVTHCDRLIAMDVLDDSECIKAYPPGHLKRFRDSQIPIYTARHAEGYNTIEYPLKDITAAFGGFSYFNTTVAYAIALAIFEGVDELMLFGCDFTYPNVHLSESGRACCEFWLGIAVARGVKLTIASSSTLMDQNTNRPEYAYVPDGQGYKGIT